MNPQQAYLEELEESLLSTPDHELWYQDDQGMWHRLDRAVVASSTYYFYEQSRDVDTIQRSMDNPYLESNDLADVIHQIREQYKMEIYDIPVEQWIFSPDAKES